VISPECVQSKVSYNTLLLAGRSLGASRHPGEDAPFEGRKTALVVVEREPRALDERVNISLLGSAHRWERRVIVRYLTGGGDLTHKIRDLWPASQKTEVNKCTYPKKNEEKGGKD